MESYENSNECVSPSAIKNNSQDVIQYQELQLYQQINVIDLMSSMRKNKDQAHSTVHI